MIVTKLTSNTIDSELINGPKNIILQSPNIILKGSKICADDVCISGEDFKKFISRINKNDFIYSSDKNNYKIFDDIVTSVSADITDAKPFKKSGSPTGWNDTSYTAASPWGMVPILNIGQGNSFPNGLLIRVPPNMGTLWIRCLNDRWSSFTLFDSSGTKYGTYTWGKRNLHTLSPDGGPPDRQHNIHMWMPIGLPTYGAFGNNTISRDFVLVNEQTVTGIDNDGWLSGIAFSTNPWNHALLLAVSLFYKFNKGDTLIGWQLLRNDHIIGIPAGKISSISVPIINTGKDKLVYIVEYEHNGDWNVLSHSGLKVGENPIERFKITYDNPFNRHYSGKTYHRYAAALIPASFVPANASFITLYIDMTKQTLPIYITEIGTHDYY
jgi:hypothetical protein